MKINATTRTNCSYVHMESEGHPGLATLQFFHEEDAPAEDYFAFYFRDPEQSWLDKFLNGEDYVWYTLQHAVRYFCGVLYPTKPNETNREKREEICMKILKLIEEVQGLNYYERN